MNKLLERRFKIYKALRHFGVSTEEMLGIAHNYPTWLDLPLEDIRTNYRIVYFYKGALYAFPFEIEALKDRLVGIAINQTVYFAYNEHILAPFSVRDYDRLSYTLYHILDLPYELQEIAKLEIELPSKEEIITLFQKINGSGIEKIHGKHVYDLVPHICVSWWVAFPEKEPKHIRIEAVDALGRPHPEDKSAVMQPIAHLRKGIDFIGHVNRFGVLDKKSLKVYQELLEKIKH